MKDSRLTDDQIAQYDKFVILFRGLLRKLTVSQIDDFVQSFANLPQITEEDVKNWDTAYIDYRTIRKEPSSIIRNVFQGGGSGKKSLLRVLTFSGSSVTDSVDSYYDDTGTTGSFSFSYNSSTRKLTITSSASEFVVGRTIIELPHNYVKPYDSESASEIVLEFYEGYEPSGETIINIRIM